MSHAPESPTLRFLRSIDPKFNLIDEYTP